MYVCLIEKQENDSSTRTRKAKSRKSQIADRKITQSNNWV